MNNKIYTTLFILLAVFLILIVFLIWPLFREIQKNSADLVSAKNNIATLNAQTSQITNFKDNYQSYKPELDKIDQLFADPNNLIGFIEFLENTASNSQVTSKISLQPSSFGPNQTPKGAPQDFIMFQSSLQGSFSQVMDFIKKIEAGPYLVEIENLNIQNSDKKVGATLTIKVYIKK